MKKISFNQNWTCIGAAVQLPHDAMIHEKRVPGHASGSAQAFFPGGRYVYEKTFEKPNAEHVVFVLNQRQAKSIFVICNPTIFCQQKQKHLNPGTTNFPKLNVSWKEIRLNSVFQNMITRTIILTATANMIAGLKQFPDTTI